MVDLKPGRNNERGILAVRFEKDLAGYKVPRHFVFAEIPKTSTGKIQKFKLREMAKGVQ
jgi:fatty-acyl-CoA synthase